MPEWSNGRWVNYSNVTCNSIDLNWATATDNIGIAYYNIELIYNPNYPAAGSLSWFNYANVTGTSYTVTGLLPDTYYGFDIIPYDAAGNSTTSPASTGVYAIKTLTDC